MSPTLTVLVTGATGQQGGAVARELLRRGHRVRALTRRPNSAAAHALTGLGAEIHTGDFDDAASMAAAAKGTDAAFIMGTPFDVGGPEAERRQSIAAIDAIGSAGVPHLLYSSVASALDGTGIPHFESKAEVERHLADRPERHTVLAPVAFLDNLTLEPNRQSLRDGVYAFPLPGDVPLQQVAIADVAALAALAFESPERYAGQRIELASIETTGTEMAARLSRIMGRTIRYHETPLDVIAQQMGEDGVRMIEFFRNGGYSVDIAALRHSHPEVDWHDLESWMGEHDWSAPTR